MRLYEGTVQQFKEDVINNRIAELLKIKFEEHYKRDRESGGEGHSFH